MRLLVVVMAVVTTTAMSIAPVSAEWFADLYAGRSLTDSHDITVKGRQAREPVDGRLHDVDFESWWMFGARLGHWFESVRFIGLAFDVARFYPTIEKKTVRASGTLDGPLLGIPAGTSFAEPVTVRETDVAVTGISFDLMLRLPLFTSESFPKGRLQPYVTVGPGLYITNVDEFNTDVSFGGKVGGGILFQLTRDLAVFGEYRFTHFKTEVDSRRLRLSTTMDSQHAIAGVSVRF